MKPTKVFWSYQDSQLLASWWYFHPTEGTNLASQACNLNGEGIWEGRPAIHLHAEC